mgnify:FL=1
MLDFLIFRGEGTCSTSCDKEAPLQNFGPHSQTTPAMPNTPTTVDSSL